MYGITTSIAQFLSYISLLEGGIGRVARAELYEPLTKKDNYEISRVYHAIKYFFQCLGVSFIVYTLLLSLEYFKIASINEVDRELIKALIWIISASTLTKYLFGITNLTLINADQKQYFGNIVVMVTTALNAAFIVILTNRGHNILIVKTVSSLIYIFQPLCFALYVKKHYSIVAVGKNKSPLKQKWTGIGQHIAYFLHTNTDVVMLTFFADIRLVAVYNVYRLIISSLGKIVNSFTGGLEALFGELIVKKEQDKLRDTFQKFNFMLLFMSTVFFGTAALLILPFVKLYTKGINDVEYIRPAFAFIILFAELLDRAIHLCASLPISSNRLKESRWGSYGEAAVNIGISLLLIWWDPLLGVAIGTLCAAILKNIYYVWFSSKKILMINAQKIVRIFLQTVVLILICMLLGHVIAEANFISSYFQWVLCGIGGVVCVAAFTAAISSFTCPKELRWMLSFLKTKYIK